MVTKLYSTPYVNVVSSHQSSVRPVVDVGAWIELHVTVVGAPEDDGMAQLPSSTFAAGSYSMKLALVHPSWGTARKQRTLWPRSTLCEGNSSTVLVAVSLGDTEVDAVVLA